MRCYGAHVHPEPLQLSVRYVSMRDMMQADHDILKHIATWFGAITSIVLSDI